MRRYLVISVIGVLAAVIALSYGLCKLYQHELKNFVAECTVNFQRAIDAELEFRASESPINLKDPQYVVKFAEDMTPEERASLKGDTITIDEAMKKNLGDNLFKILQQRMQDKRMDTNPLNLHNLDSLYGWYLQKAELEIPYCLYLYNNKKEVAESIERDLPFFSAHAKTEMKPIGTQGRMYVQAEVAVPMSDLVRQLLYALLLFTVALVVVFTCFSLDLRVIREQRASIYHPLHDLKGPLSVVFAALGNLIFFETDKEKKQELVVAQSAVRELTETLESVLSLMRNNGRNQLNIEEVDVKALITECSEGLLQLYAAKKPTLLLNTEGLREPVRTDAILLKRILRNLIENALKYSDEGVKLEIITTSRRGEFEISAKDNGWGIPAKDLKKLGKQFYRVRREGRKAQEGFGIGLACVKKLCKDLGGKLQISSREGEGSIFTVKLKNYGG